MENYLDEQGLATYDTLIKSYISGVMTSRSEIPQSQMAVINDIDSHVDTMFSNYVTKADLLNALANIGGGETLTVSAESGMYAKITSGNTVIKQSAVDGDIVTIPFGVQYEWELYNSGGTRVLSGNGITSQLSETINTKQESVDLGLPSGKLWAACNVGTLSKTSPGLYFSWGNITGHYQGEGYNFSSANYSSTPGGALSGSFTPGDERYDAARVYMGRDWCMPTNNDFTELFNNCTWTWTSVDGVSGYNVSGQNGNSIFLPQSGFYTGVSYGNVSDGWYWSTNRYDSSMAYFLKVNSSSKEKSYYYRYCGLPIRAVRSPQS